MTAQPIKYKKYETYKKTNSYCYLHIIHDGQPGREEQQLNQISENDKPNIRVNKHANNRK